MGTIELKTVDELGARNRVGRATYVELLHLWDSATEILADFTTRFTFTIDLKGCRDTTTGSDGFAFYLASVGYEIPPNSAGYNLGLFNITTRGGVPGNQIVFFEFDTWENPDIDPPPPVQKHIGINNNNISSLAYVSWNLDYNRTQNVVIIYNATTKDLAVFLTLTWNVRYKIALGLASAIHYLHEDAEQCVLHRDIKSANVLLDEDFSTRLGDSGVAKLVDPLLGTQMTGVVGTYGYLAPEYFNHGRASKESDIYSFGVVALEIARGRRTYLDNEGYHVPLVKWVWELYVAGDILNEASERLKMEFHESEMICLLIVGLWCTHSIDRERPKAGQVIKVLQLEVPLPELPHDMHEYIVNPTHGQANSIQSQPVTSSLYNGGR
ncbi:Lectin receptor kinase [Quillaja saponaria]|uniref:Lectin receptor kinase n=1 Tax=Quillaja saponaria TaxID=32244 RepID=A0AAD7PK19_QUISA|nr:Lectin receptor kinase [Quillaja saponaria]